MSRQSFELLYHRLSCCNLGSPPTWSSGLVRCIIRVLCLLLNASCSGANPDFSSDELFYQLEQTKACLVIAHPESMDKARSAVQKAKLPLSRLILFDTRQQTPKNYLKIGALIEKGLTSLPAFLEKKLNPGEAKTKLAFLSFSSGTTGKPKVVH